jgi:dienelactone hydrolase
VSFHGTLSTPTPEDARNIQGRVLILHGADDDTAKIDEVIAIIKEMRDAKVAFDLHLYGRVLHGFTETKNGFDPSEGKAYDAHADKESWTAMQALFSEVFQT